MSTVLMYHYVGSPQSSGDPHAALWVPREEFAGQLATLRAMKIRTLSPEEYGAGLSAGTLGRSVWLTFDDGQIDNYSVALPLLAEAGLRATFFIIAARSLGGDANYVSVSQMKEMISAGMSIGYHTVTHPRLARLDDAALREEIVGSRKRLEDALGIAITSFCYPYGNLDDRVVAMVEEAGYALATSTVRDNRNTPADRFRLRRAMVQPGRTGLRFRYLFSTLYHLVHARKNRNRWRKSAAR